MQKKKIAIFDFDKTIIRKDSMFLFVWYGIKKQPMTMIHLIRMIWNTVLYKLKLITVERVKSSYFYIIRYMKESDLEQFYDTMLSPHFYQEALSELKINKQHGYHNIIVTASPHAYVKYMRKLPFVDEVIGTELERQHGNYTNHILGRNCKGEEKVTRINEYLQKAGFQIDYEHSNAYSDSLCDMPIFQLVKNRYLINLRNPDLEELRWKF
jgi:phosphatidylglycerophosphatase C